MQAQTWARIQPLKLSDEYLFGSVAEWAKRKWLATFLLKASRYRMHLSLSRAEGRRLVQVLLVSRTYFKSVCPPPF